jgi:TIR domain
MASLYEYYEKDFSNTIKIHIKIKYNGLEVEGRIHYDFSAFCSFASCYFSDSHINIEYFKEFLDNFKWGQTKILFGGKITLPDLKTYEGELTFHNTTNEINPFLIESRFWGETEWKSGLQLSATKRIFLYSESGINDTDRVAIYKYASENGKDLQFRSIKYRDSRSGQESPFAFISHDSSDKDEVAKPIALTLQKFFCPVWYDEFSLKVGDNLRMSIEKGLKECKKCILILSPNFLENKGWTKAEFESIFTRQILEKQNFILPVWYNISAKDVYEYSPSLLNIKGLDWNKLGQDEVCRQLHKAIDN